MMTILRVCVGIGVGLVAGVTVTWTTLVTVLVQEIAGISKANINTTARLLHETVLILPGHISSVVYDLLAGKVNRYRQG